MLAQTGSGRLRYLHTIYLLAKKGDAVRSIQIAQVLGVTRTSVHKMMKQLADMQWIAKNHYGKIQLTQEGLGQAEIFDRQYAASRVFFANFLGLAADESEESAYLLMTHFSDRCIDRLVDRMAGDGQAQGFCL